MTHDPYRKLLEDLVDGCGRCANGGCLLMEILLRDRKHPRVLVQLKCVELFKFFRSQRENRDIGWHAAHMLWCDEGHAAKFAEVYRDGMRPAHVYRLVIEESGPEVKT
jgi:hypothetical protein